MNCFECKSEISENAKFCSDCGKAITLEQDIKTTTEISLDWLKLIFEEKKYTVTEMNEDNSSFIARSNDLPVIQLEWRKKVNAIIFRSYWNLRKMNFFEKKSLFEAINKGAAHNIFLSCYATDDLDSVVITSALFTSGQLSKKNISDFLQIVIDGCYPLLRKSGLTKFIPKG